MIGTNPCVLIVDDVPDGREMLCEYLTLRGFDVIEAPTGEEALTQARTRRPAVILMDLRMPGLGGLAATRELKADPSTIDIIVIAVTAQAFVPDVVAARAAGAMGLSRSRTTFKPSATPSGRSCGADGAAWSRSSVCRRYRLLAAKTDRSWPTRTFFQWSTRALAPRHAPPQ